MTAELIDVVDMLTLPQPERVAQRDGDGWRTSWVSHDALLVQLRNAAGPGASDGNGSASLKSTRSLIDADALDELRKIEAEVRKWCREWGVAFTGDLVDDVRAWYAATRAAVDFDETWHVQRTQAWVHQIRRRLHPPAGFTLAFPCPVCGQREWSDGKPDGDGGTFPLRIEYYNIDGRMTRERAVCRNPECGTLWLGRAAVVELAEELTEVPFDTIMTILSAPTIEAELVSGGQQ